MRLYKKEFDDLRENWKVMKLRIEEYTIIMNKRE